MYDLRANERPKKNEWRMDSYTHRPTDRQTLQLYDWPDPEGQVSENGILTLTRLNGLLGSDKQSRHNQTIILTLTSLNGLLGSD